MLAVLLAATTQRAYLAFARDLIKIMVCTALETLALRRVTHCAVSYRALLALSLSSIWCLPCRALDALACCLVKNVLIS